MTKTYVDDDGSSVFQRQNERKVYSEIYEEKYVNRRHVLSVSNIKICKNT